MYNKRITDAFHLIQRTTGIKVPHNGLTGFDIIEFDNILKSHNPDYKDISMRDFIEKKYGQEIVQAFLTLIDAKPLLIEWMRNER